jgi:hypothetical protein
LIGFVIDADDDANDDARSAARREREVVFIERERE